jgi:hypothetical protein
MCNSANVVLVCMSDYECNESIALLDNELRICHLDFWLWYARFGERNPAIHHQPMIIVAE